jgi:perosamine synthetase
MGLDAKSSSSSKESSVMEREFMPVAAPMLVGNEKAYVADCLESTWISSRGGYIERFEAAFAEFCGVRHAMTCSNGTVALHLALLALDVGPGDEVIVPTLTYVATANAVRYCGARPVFIDAEADTWNLDPSAIESKITPRTKGVIVVHLFGHPVDMAVIRSIADRHGLFVVEDAAQAHGAECRGRRVGSFGDVATFSFYGNKIITTGEGGMVLTNQSRIADRVRLLKSQGMDPQRRYWFPVIGYNYRMTNVAAAIGLGQLEKIAWHLDRRSEVAGWYREELRAVSGLKWQVEHSWARHVWWMFSVVLDNDVPVERDQVMAELRKREIETRPLVIPIHTLPPYREIAGPGIFPVAEGLAQQGISLPTWAKLTRDDVRYVCDSLIETCRLEANVCTQPHV